MSRTVDDYRQCKNVGEQFHSHPLQMIFKLYFLLGKTLKHTFHLFDNIM